MGLSVFATTVSLAPSFVPYQTTEFKLSMPSFFNDCYPEPERKVNHGNVYLQFPKLGQALKGSGHDGAD